MIYLPNGYPDFANLTADILRAEFDELITVSRDELASLKADTSSPTFENSVLPIERMRRRLRLHHSLCKTLALVDMAGYMDTSRNIGQENRQFMLSIAQDEDLCARVQHVHDNVMPNDAEDRLLLERVLFGFVNVGVPEAQKAKYVANSLRVKMLETAYARNMAERTKSNLLILDKGDVVSGVASDYVEKAAIEAEKRGLGDDKLCFTLSAALAVHFLYMADDRHVREQVYLQHYTFDDAVENWQVAAELMSLRAEQARALGYDHYVASVLGYKRLAKSKDDVQAMYDAVSPQVVLAAKAEIAHFSELAKRDGIDDFQPWDVAYYRRVAVREAYDFDVKNMRPYAQLDLVMDGLFDHVRQFTGWTFEARPDLPATRKDATTYAVLDTHGEQFAWMICDLYADAGNKKEGARVMPVRAHYVDELGQRHLPVYALNTNFSKGIDGAACLLMPHEITTLFHEMGHVMDGINGRAKHVTLSPFSGPWDGVEIPSRFMEEYWQTPEFARSYLLHHETGEAMSADMMAQFKGAESAMNANILVRRVAMGCYDIAAHSVTGDVSVSDLLDLKAAVVAPLGISEWTRTDDYICSFHHIHSGAYAAGYYSYMWADMRGLAMFDTFQAQGLYDASLTAQFKDCVLGKGAVSDVNKAYSAITGQDTPDVKPILRRFGIA